LSGIDDSEDGLEIVDAICLANALCMVELGNSDVLLDLGEGLVNIILLSKGKVRDESHSI
jgi:hypothetical protein